MFFANKLASHLLSLMHLLLFSIWDWAAGCAKDGLCAPSSREVVQVEPKSAKHEDVAKNEGGWTELEKLVKVGRDGREAGDLNDSAAYGQQALDDLPALFSLTV